MVKDVGISELHLHNLCFNFLSALFLLYINRNNIFHVNSHYTHFLVPMHKSVARNIAVRDTVWPSTGLMAKNTDQIWDNRRVLWVVENLDLKLIVK